MIVNQNKKRETSLLFLVLHKNKTVEVSQSEFDTELDAKN